MYANAAVIVTFSAVAKVCARLWLRSRGGGGGGLKAGCVEPLLRTKGMKHLGSSLRAWASCCLKHLHFTHLLIRFIGTSLKDAFSLQRKATVQKRRESSRNRQIS